MSAPKAGYPVLVTGGSGCLGQHVIKLLHTHADHVTEIRVVDVVPYKKKLEYQETKPVTSFCVDIGDLTDTSPFRGVKVVFHLAAVISVSKCPDIAAMERVNVEGTRKVLEACVTEDVPALIYSSTVDVVIGFEPIHMGTEATTSRPGSLMYEGYGSTKQKAEDLVREFNGRKLESGATFSGVILRPNVFFGELDAIFVPQVLKTAHDNKGSLIQMGDGTALYQQTYVGNAAWTFLCAEQVLRSNPASVAGEAFFVTDDSPVKSFSAQMLPFLKERGFVLSGYRIPFWLINSLISPVEFCLWLMSPMKKMNLGFSSRSIRYITTTFCFSGEKARKMLGYTPLFSPEESLQMANAYYSELTL